MGKNKQDKSGEKGGKGGKGGKKGGGGDDSSEAKSGGGKLKGGQSINVRHILCEKHKKFEEAQEKLKDGASFDDVAKDMSEDKAKAGGSLGWKPKGSLDPKFEEVAYELEVSTVKNPKFGTAKTGFGYHIIMVEGRK